MADGSGFVNIKRVTRSVDESMKSSGGGDDPKSRVPA